MPAIREIEELMDAMVLGITLFVFLLVGLGILNTMMMSVLERTREFGVMRALGARPGRIVSLVVAEAFWIALLAVLAGTALGLLGTWAGSGGTLLDFSSPGIESWEYSGAVLDAAVRTTAVPAATPMAAGLVFVLTTLIGIIPAWRVSRMEPARALRAN
jgi:ABC-type antimicrobial peptide transport system permease subunit